jgi:hypothetical protein
VALEPQVERLHDLVRGVEHVVGTPALAFLVTALAVAACGRSAPQSQAGGGGSAGSAPEACRLTAVTPLIPDESAPGAIAGLITDGAYVYFTDPNTQHLSRLPVNAGPVESLGHVATHLAARAGSLLFGSTLQGDIIELGSDGSSPKTLASGHQGESMATDGVTLFWSDVDAVAGTSDIWSVPVAGGDPSKIVAARKGSILQLWVSSSGALVWGEWVPGDPLGGASIVTSAQDGSSPQVLSTIPEAMTMAFDRSGFYVANQTAILFVPSSGGDPSTFIDAQTGVDMIVTDETRLYWTQTINCTPEPNVGNGRPICDGQLSAAAKSGGPVSILIGAGPAGTLAVDDACLYWTTAAGQFHGEGTVSLRGGPKKF